jgi:putative hemolysin
LTGSGWLWVGLIAMGLGALLSALFHSLKDMTRTTLEELAQLRGNAGAMRRIDKILDDVDAHSTAVALPRIVCNMIVAVSAVSYLAALRGEVAPGAGTVVLGIALASIVIWLFGLVIPHSIAVHAGEHTIYTWSWLVRACYIVQIPLRRVVSFFDEVVRRLAGKDSDSDAEEIEAELMSVVEEGQEEGQFDQTERDMIEAVMEFRSTTVEQIMTPRTEVEAMELTNNLGDIVRFIRECHHSRIPVYEENLDHIVGVFYIRDLVRWLAGDTRAGGVAPAVPNAAGTAAGVAAAAGATDAPPQGAGSGRANGKPFDLRAILRPALFVPETKTVRELLTELVGRKVHIAMVADEYGGTSGLVTLEDIIEEIFGEIQDEYEITEDDEPDVKVETEFRTAEIDARAYIDDANDALRAIGVALPEGEDYDTVGGLVVTTLGRIPAVGESLRLNGTTITIVEAEPTRVNRIRLEIGDGHNGHSQDGAQPPQGDVPAAPPQVPAEESVVQR